ncbi:hypothetical protein L914_19605 [Phytophthora nicotianae]|uniref:Uncharacterized protein n=1 Tax=Phytophthora nicotianae TaxID=4792 RepID=W2M9W6_PHYNI|nr:hypothetical protein L914_19605 [Phytophthora nicotianae]
MTATIPTSASFRTLWSILIVVNGVFTLHFLHVLRKLVRRLVFQVSSVLNPGNLMSKLQASMRLAIMVVRKMLQLWI